MDRIPDFLQNTSWWGHFFFLMGVWAVIASLWIIGYVLTFKTKKKVVTIIGVIILMGSIYGILPVFAFIFLV